MAAEIIHSGLETDLRLAVQMERAIRYLLTAMGSIRATGGLSYVGDVAGTLSDTTKARYVAGPGYDVFADATEIEEVANTALVDASVNVAVARSSLVHEIGDLADLTGSETDVNIMFLASKMAMGWERKFNRQVAAVADDFSTTVGATNTEFGVDNLFDAKFALNVANNRGRLVGIFKPRQINQLVNDLRSETGALQYMQPTQDLISRFGDDFAGSMIGIDLFQNDDVAVTGGAAYGAVFSMGGILWASGTAKPDIDPNGRVIRPAGTPVTVEFERSPRKAVTAVIGNAWSGAAIGEQGRGCTVISINS